MILQALSDYYARLADEGHAPVMGFEEKAIPFLIVLGNEGTFRGIDDTRDPKNKKDRGRLFSIPQAVKRTVGVSANLLWDNAGYAFAEPKVDPTKDADKLVERADQQHAAFIDAVRELYHELPDDPGLSAVMRFLEAGDFSAVRAHPSWPEIAEGGGNLTFRLESDYSLVCQRSAVRALIAARAQSVSADSVTMTCLVTGRTEPVSRLHTSIKGVWGAQSSGANIVSFNLDAFNSYGHDQSYNAPVSAPAEFAYTTALNMLLAGSQRFQVGDTSTVYWASEADERETSLGPIFGGAKSVSATATDDDADQVVKRAFTVPEGSTLPEEEALRRFYILGLAPNASRIAIRFWYAGTVGEIWQRMADYLQAIRIVHGPKRSDFVPLWRLLAHTAMQGKTDRLPPNLGGDVMRAILLAQPMPQALLSATVRRCRAEQDVTHERAALIKLCFTYPSTRSTQEITVFLDPENTNTGYRLGRLFAVLERAQEMASPGLNSTIRERYYGSASTSPRGVFPILMKLKNHHLAKLDGKGLRIWLESIIGEIVGGITDFPATLPLDQQGLFAIGYYHQRQAFFEKKGTDSPDAPAGESVDA